MANQTLPASLVTRIHEYYPEKPQPLITTFVDFLVSSAHAAGEAECNIEPENPEFILSQGEAILETVLKCMIGKKVRESKVRYETADGWQETAIAAVELATYQTLYTQLYVGGKSLLAALECADGVLTGKPSSGIGMTCDLISGLLLIGDIRDVLYQSYYYFIDDEENFSPLVATFAALGIFGTVAEVAAGPAGIAADAALAAGKTIPKTFAGAKFTVHLSDWLNKYVLIGDISKGAQNLNKAMPFIQITAFLGFMGFSDDLKPVRDLISGAIDTPDDLKTWMSYTEESFKALSSTPVVLNGYPEQLQEILVKGAESALEFLVSSAYAVGIKPEDILTKGADEFIKVLQRVQSSPNLKSGAGTIEYRVFTHAIKRLQINVARGVDNLDDIAFKSDTIKALITAYRVGGEDALKHLRNYQGLASGLRSNGIGTWGFIKELSNLDITKLSPDVIKGLAGVFQDFGSVFNKSSGATHQMLKVIEHIKAGDIVEGVEKQVIITSSSGAELARRYDVVVRVGGPSGKLVRYEMKAWSKKTIESFLKLGITKSVKGADGDLPGQLFKDILSFREKGFTGIKWAFDNRASVLGKDKIRNLILDGVEEAETAFRKEFGMVGRSNDNRWDEFLRDLDANLGEMIEIAE